MKQDIRVFDRKTRLFLVVLSVVAFLVVILNQLVPMGSALHVSTYTVTLLGKYLTYALLAVAVDLIWGYMGILSLGHGAFFCPWRLCHGHVSDASDRRSWCVW
jgi:urea transport system permease protein